MRKQNGEIACMKKTVELLNAFDIILILPKTLLFVRKAEKCIRECAYMVWVHILVGQVDHRLASVSSRRSLVKLANNGIQGWRFWSWGRRHTCHQKLTFQSLGIQRVP